jgi:hypothetical protein
MTALDYLQNELPNIYHARQIELSDVQQAMEEYAQYKVNELNKSDVIKSVCTCMAFHKSDECYKLGCKAHRSDEVQTVL